MRHMKRGTGTKITIMAIRRTRTCRPTRRIRLASLDIVVAAAYFNNSLGLTTSWTDARLILE